MAFRPKKKKYEIPDTMTVPGGASELPPMPQAPVPGEFPGSTVQSIAPPLAPLPQYNPHPPAPTQQAPTAPAAAPAPMVPAKQPQVWTVSDIPTETTQVIYNPATGETLDIISGIVRILNIFEEIKVEE